MVAGGGATPPALDPARAVQLVRRRGACHLEPIKLDVSGYVAAVADRIPLDLTTDWHFDVHQWRTVCHVDVDSVSVPEGPHQDGHEFGAVVVVSRPWVVGGITTLYSLGDRRPFHETTLGPSEALLFDDRRMLHFTSNIRASDQDGYRDIFVFNINSWDNRKYGLDFELALPAIGPRGQGTFRGVRHLRPDRRNNPLGGFLVDTNKAANLLLESRLSKRRLDALPFDCRPATQDEAYACQRSLIERLKASGAGHPVGYKIGCTNPYAQRLLNLDGPFYGFLLSHACMTAPRPWPRTTSS